MAHLHLIDKPEGWTSHDAVARLRRILGERRVGHAGTLDPFATGLLVAAEGRATVLLGLIGQFLPKRYVAIVRLGWSTDTQDRTGHVLPGAGPATLPSAAAFDAVLASFRGALRQVPPMYSAVRVDGLRLHHVARRGGTMERAARPVFVYALDRIDHATAAAAGVRVQSSQPASPPTSPAPATPPSAGASIDFAVDVTVSSGTYVRTLAHDIGERLGCGAHLVALRRVSIGPFDVADAGRVEREGGWDAEAFRVHRIQPSRALSFLPHVALTIEESTRLRYGAAPTITAERIVNASSAYPLPPGEAGWPLALLDSSGELAGVGRPWNEQEPGMPLALVRVLSGNPDATVRASTGAGVEATPA